MNARFLRPSTHPYGTARRRIVAELSAATRQPKVWQRGGVGCVCIGAEADGRSAPAAAAAMAAATITLPADRIHAPFYHVVFEWHAPFKTWALEPRARTRHSSNGRRSGLPRRIIATPKVSTVSLCVIGSR